MLATYRVGALTKVPITKVFVKEAAGLCEGGWLLSDQGEPVLVGKHPHPHEWVMHNSLGSGPCPALHAMVLLT